jgi:peptidoglycan/xylan/chitin deacetylase (PgdA/CDA1 family)
MGFYWIKTNRLIKWIFPKYIWDIPNKDKTLYLTFDDGPTPEITEWALNQLAEFNVKATFFCIGNNIKNHPQIFEKLIREGHAIGNHTFNHRNGWETELDVYLENVGKCDAIISKLTGTPNKLFRPPYGKIKKSQAQKLLGMGYKIIMWDVLSADFDQTISPEKCLHNVLSNVKSGSIIVFHDSVKSFKNLEYVLPKTLLFLQENGFKCKVIA